MESLIKLELTRICQTTIIILFLLHFCPTIPSIYMWRFALLKTWNRWELIVVFLMLSTTSKFSFSLLSFLSFLIRIFLYVNVFFNISHLLLYVPIKKIYFFQIVHCVFIRKQYFVRQRQNFIHHSHFQHYIRKSSFTELENIKSSLLPSKHQSQIINYHLI